MSVSKRFSQGLFLQCLPQHLSCCDVYPPGFRPFCLCHRALRRCLLANLAGSRIAGSRSLPLVRLSHHHCTVLVGGRDGSGALGGGAAASSCWDPVMATKSHHQGVRMSRPPRLSGSQILERRGTKLGLQTEANYMPDLILACNGLCIP